MKGFPILLPLIVVTSIFAGSFSVPLYAADNAVEIADKNAQIQQIQQQIAQYQRQIDSIHGQALTLQGQVNSLNAQINQITLELKSLSLSIGSTNLQINDTQSKISVAEEKISKDQVALGEYLRLVYQNDQETLTSVLIKHETLSDFFDELNSVKTIQDELKVTIDNILDLKTSLEDQKADLEDRKAELVQQQNLVSIEKRSLDQAKAQKAKLLADTKGQESKFQELVKRSQKDIESIRAQITYLQQNGVTAEDAVKYGQLAALAVGIRPAFLIAELEQESGLGSNVGKCNRAGDPPSKGYRVIMKPERDIQPFLNITAQLGLDPESTTVSCPQFINGKQYGWGGAMGPAQFIPSTWMGYRDRVTQIVGHTASPWNIQDAFTAAAVKLANAGATGKTPAAEIAASKAYYSGNSKCSTAPCNSYANSVQRIAAQLERSL